MADNILFRSHQVQRAQYSGLQEQSFSGTDVSVVFSIHGSHPSYLAETSSFYSTQLQTITLTSATSIFPVRRLGEASATTQTKGARTCAGSMVFTILGKDPLQDIFSIDAIRSSARTDGQWHVDQMPPIDCMLMFANETGSSGMQIIQNMQISNWGQTVSIDDIYLESTFTFIADHITPFLSSDKIRGELDNIVNSISDKSKTPDSSVARSIEVTRKDIIKRYGRYNFDVTMKLMEQELQSRIREEKERLEWQNTGLTANTYETIHEYIKDPGNVALLWTYAAGPEIAAEVKNLTYTR